MKAGRKTKLTPELHDEFVRRIKAGAFATTAALACGISRDTWQRWQRRGREESEGIYRDLVTAVDEASAIAESAAVATIIAAARSQERVQWQAAAWFLERRFPSRWARGNGCRDPKNAPKSTWFEESK